MNKKCLKVVVSLVLGSFILIASCMLIGSRHLKEIQKVAPQYFSERGFNIIIYEGYQYDLIMGSRVWYVVQQKNTANNTLYIGAICKWFNEYHLYEFKAIDAIKSN